MSNGHAPAPRMGRPRLAEGEAKSARVVVRLTLSERVLFQRLGGAAWLRWRLEEAKYSIAEAAALRRR